MRWIVLVLLLWVTGCCCDSNSSSGSSGHAVERAATLVLTADCHQELRVITFARTTLSASNKFDYLSWNLTTAMKTDGEQYLAKPSYLHTKTWPALSMASPASADWAPIGEWTVTDRQTGQAAHIAASGMWYPDQLRLAIRYEVRNGGYSKFTHVLDLNGNVGGQPVAKYDLRKNVLMLSAISLP